MNSCTVTYMTDKYYYTNMSYNSWKQQQKKLFIEMLNSIFTDLSHNITSLTPTIRHKKQHRELLIGFSEWIVIIPQFLNHIFVVHIFCQQNIIRNNGKNWKLEIGWKRNWYNNCISSMCCSSEIDMRWQYGSGRTTKNLIFGSGWLEN